MGIWNFLFGRRHRPTEDLIINTDPDAFGEAPYDHILIGKAERKWPNDLAMQLKEYDRLFKKKYRR